MSKILRHSDLSSIWNDLERLPVQYVFINYRRSLVGAPVSVRHMLTAYITLLANSYQ